jgi:hypothetical protein
MRETTIEDLVSKWVDEWHVPEGRSEEELVESLNQHVLDEKIKAVEKFAKFLDLHKMKWDLWTVRDEFITELKEKNG